MNTSRLAIAAVLAAVVSTASHAQDAAPETQASTSTGFEDIVVTARKKARAEALQSIPMTVSAVSGARLEEAQIKNLAQMTGSIPNASLDEVGAAKGTAAFSIRGVAMGSTLPTLESPVGVFIDGMYMPSVLGVITDFFDVETVEVLRGPQGTLFGKNVTAGAVLVNSRRPTDQFEGYVHSSIETGLEYKLGGAISGPITDNLKVRLAAQWDHDDGWFHNDFDGKAYGRGTTWLIRPTVEWDPTPDLNVIVRFEHGKSTTKGLPLQNYAFQDRHTFNFAQDHEGGTHLEWDQITGEVNWQIGGGTLTNVIGYRDNKIITDYDTAGTPIKDYQINYTNPTKSFSNELRYSGRYFDRLDLTVGVYYFQSNIRLLETRRLRTVANFEPRSYGARQKAKTYAAFIQGDLDITDKLKLTAGLRYTYDKKHADVGLFMAAGDTCNPLTGECVYAYPNLKGNWDSWSPKVGLQYIINDDAQVYASYSKGYRAGGFTSRQTAPAQALRWIRK
jgi:iron complex outermembrane receptor protein